MQKLRSEYSRILSTESAKDESEVTEQRNPTPVYSQLVAQAILGIVMVTIGYKYTWKFHNGGEEGVSTEEDNLCPNGAAWWLWVAGIVHLILPLMVVLDALNVMCIQVFACFIPGILIVDYIAMLIWGSVAVFGAWSNWTDDFNTYKANPEELNFCQHIPMMTAFVILILRWVLIPAMFAMICCMGCCLGCCAICCLPHP